MFIIYNQSLAIVQLPAKTTESSVLLLAVSIYFMLQLVHEILVKYKSERSQYFCKFPVANMAD